MKRRTKDGREMKNKKNPKVGQLVKVGFIDAEDIIGLVVARDVRDGYVMILRHSFSKSGKVVYDKVTVNRHQIMEFGSMISLELMNKN